MFTLFRKLLTFPSHLAPSNQDLLDLKSTLNYLTDIKISLILVRNQEVNKNWWTVHRCGNKFSLRDGFVPAGPTQCNTRSKSINVVQNTTIMEGSTNLTQSKIIARVVSIIENCKCYSFENMIIKVLIYFDWNSCLLSWLT